jgi:dienelactone hydrolase
MGSPRSLAALAFGLAAALAGCAGVTRAHTMHTTAPNGAAERIPVSVTRPSGSGPFPAVVIMHDCSGLGPSSSNAPERWTAELVRRGYVVIVPDSFGSRGFPGGVCSDPSPGRVDVAPPRRARDAYAALAYARALPDVDGKRVGLMGGSHGGSTTLSSMVAPQSAIEPLAAEKDAGFAAAIALYPGCAVRLGDWRGASGTGVYRPVAPLLILVGALDDWTPAEPCRRLAESARAAGYPVAIKIYPGAHHSFDSANPVRYVATRMNASSPTGRGATTGGNAEAWADSIRKVAAFFARHLGGAMEATSR